MRARSYNERQEKRARLRARRALHQELAGAALGDVPPVKLAAERAPAPRPVSVRSVSTQRTPGVAQSKQGELLSPTYLEWVREQPCAFCPGDGASRDAHHFPTRGASGRTIDLLTASACRRCHQLCDVAEHNGGYSRERQRAAVAATWEAFLRRAPRELVHQVLREAVAGLAG